MANVKFIAVSRGLRGIVDYVTNREKTVEQLISGVNCVARTAVPEFEAVKNSSEKRRAAATTTSCRRSHRMIHWTLQRRTSWA